MNNEMVQKLYTQKNSLYHGLFFGFFRYDKGIRDFFQEKVVLQQGYKILDAGCGSGLLTKTLFQLGIERKIENIRFYAFDITKAMLDIFKGWILNNNIDRVSILQADVLKTNELPASWDKFDLIVSSAMLEHLDKSEIKAAISNLKAMLTEDGKFIFAITRSNLITKYLIEKLWKAHSYREDEILNILKEVGFDQVKTYRFPLNYWYLNIWGFIFEAKFISSIDVKPI